MNATQSATTAATQLDAFLAKPQRLLIGAAWVPAQSNAVIDIIDPATGIIFAHAAAGGSEDINAAVRAARTTLDSNAWASMPVVRRRKLLLDLADAVEGDADLLSLIETRDNGMPLFAARLFGVGLAVEALRYAAGWVGKLGGETLSTSYDDKLVYTLKEPVGVVGAIIPWNAPLGMAAEHIAAAIATGCTLVLKPAELSPLSAIRLGQLALQVGVPAGVINIVTGHGPVAGSALAAHPGVDKIAFTGSTATGKLIMASAASTLKRVTLELGGKSPVIIFPDADIDAAVGGAAGGVFANSGQICVAGSRLYVHAKVYDRVVAGIAAKAQALKVGSGLDPGVQIGPLISQRQLSRVQGYIASGIEQGATVVTGGDVSGPGYFIKPTVLADTRDDMTLMREEIFGPVICAMRFDDEDLQHIAALANNSDYGLAAYIWTRDISIAHRLARRIKAGSVIVNGGPLLDMNVPSGGYKQSGVGRQHGRMGLEAYLETKTIAVTLSAGMGH
jgi:phenylacetaldehyde dehydrogenase